MVLVGKAVGHDGHHAQVTIPGDHGLVVRERFVFADGPALFRDPGAGAPPPICGAEIWEALKIGLAALLADLRSMPPRREPEPAMVATQRGACGD
jgi:hypothetical protein